MLNGPYCEQQESPIFLHAVKTAVSEREKQDIKESQQKMVLLIVLAATFNQRHRNGTVETLRQTTTATGCCRESGQ